MSAASGIKLATPQGQGHRDQMIDPDQMIGRQEIIVGHPDQMMDPDQMISRQEIIVGMQNLAVQG